MGQHQTHAYLVIEPIVQADIRALFPLMREIEPLLNLSSWLVYARRLVSRRNANAGILVARRSTGGFPCGAVCFSCINDLRHHRILLAEHFVSADLLYPHAVSAALVAALELIAIEHGCQALRANLHAQHSKVTSDLLHSGFRQEGTALLRTL